MSALYMYFTPKSSTTSEKKIGHVMCCHNPRVCVTSNIHLGQGFLLGLFLRVHLTVGFRIWIV